MRYKFILLLLLLAVLACASGRKLGKGISKKSSRFPESQKNKRNVEKIQRNSWEDDMDDDDSDDVQDYDLKNHDHIEHLTKDKKASIPTTFNLDSLYQIIANHLSEFSEENSLLHRTPIDEVERALRTLASAQAAWKSVDGATHQLKSSVKASSTSLDSRFRRFLARKMKSTKEAAKINEYIDIVERGLQSTEILQAIIQEATNERRRTRFLQEAGLQEIARFSIQHPHKKDVSVLVTVLHPSQPNSNDDSNSISSAAKFSPKEIVVAITDNIEDDSPERLYSALFRIAEEELPARVPIHSKALVATLKPSERRKISSSNNTTSEILVLPTLVDMAQQIVKKLQPFLPSAYEEMNANDNSSYDTDDNIAKESKQSSIGMSPTIRIIGHSCGGTIAAYVSMLLDGFLSSNQSDSFAFLSPGQVKCMTFGAMPCVSRSVIPAFVTSLICGDDFLCRLQHTNVKNLQKKVSEAVTHGAGKKGLSWFTGVSLLSELSHTASKQLGHYQGRKKEFKDTLQLPGRVFYIKSRQLKQGATLQRVLRGNWQEEVMWNIRDFVLSPKMLKHHELEAYIRTLNRC